MFEQNGLGRIVSPIELDLNRSLCFPLLPSDDDPVARQGASMHHFV
jgi:hypothetical protein